MTIDASKPSKPSISPVVLNLPAGQTIPKRTYLLIEMTGTGSIVGMPRPFRRAGMSLPSSSKIRLSVRISRPVTTFLTLGNRVIGAVGSDFAVYGSTGVRDAIFTDDSA